MKHFAASVGLLASLVAAVPVEKRQDYVGDATILNYALTLEHLEDTFYREGLAKFSAADFEADGFPASVYANLQEVSKDEQTHVSFLTAGLQAAGATPVEQCTYNFPYSDPKGFLALSSVLEGVGVSAYLGAAMDIINKDYLTDAGAILTVESRHSAYIRESQPIARSPFPSAFDDPLDFNEVYTLASSFIVACPPSSPPLPFKAFPALALADMSGNPVKAGAVVEVLSPALALPSSVYAAFITVTGPVFTPVTTNGNSAMVTIPAGVTGQSYLVFTNSMSVDDNTIIAGPAIVMILAPYTIMPDRSF